MKHEKPSDFKCIYDKLERQNSLSVNSLVRHYGVSPSVVNRWLGESDLVINKSNDKKENHIDMFSFRSDVECGEYNVGQISLKYSLTRKNVYGICKRNGIEQNFQPEYFEPLDEKEFIEYLKQNGKQKTARKYGITIAIINGWCERNKFDLPKYHGRKRNDLVESTDSIIKMYQFGYSMNFIGSIYNISGSKVREILESNNVNVVTTFDMWDKSKEYINDNLEHYALENKNGLNLQEISNKYDISYEQLKDAFSNNGIDVILHSYNKSKGELQLKEFLKSMGFDVKSIKKKHDDVRFEIDCFIEDMNFGIEYCGEYWHSVNNGIGRKYHHDKYKWAKGQGIRLMTVFENEWLRNQELVKSMIRVRLGIVDKKVYARKTEISLIPNSVAKKFHDKNHISGGLKTSYVNIGLFHEGNLISVASFSKSRFSKEAEYEVLRFSTLQNMSVIGGFGKVLNHFIELYNPASIVSFCDLRFGEGGVYEKTGFELISTTPPNYWYYYKNSGSYGKFESRIKYQKHNLKMFSNFSNDKTEYQIMAENGYLKIYDCGSHKYIWRRN